MVVEVRQPTLRRDGRGWGPAANTGRGWPWLGSGSQHWAGMAVVEVRQPTLGEDGCSWGPAAGGGEEKEEEEEEAAALIKSNNPHLAGGEITPRTMVYDTYNYSEWGLYL